MKRIYCVHGTCNSNTRDADPNLFMIPFLKPCASFYKNIVDPTAVSHNPKQCDQCSRVLKWIHMCKRADKKMNLCDISTKTYIGSRHFHENSGPTEENPDPFPANKPEYALVSTYYN